MSDKVERIALSQADAAKAIGVTDRTLRKLTRAGKIECSRISRTLVLYSVDSLKAFLEKNKEQKPAA